jgi:hypothetical protein
MMRDEQGELIPGLPWKEQDSTGKIIFYSNKFGLKFVWGGGGIIQ